MIVFLTILGVVVVAIHLFVVAMLTLGVWRIAETLERLSPPPDEPPARRSRLGAMIGASFAPDFQSEVRFAPDDPLRRPKEDEG